VTEDARLSGVKILGDGELKVALTVKLPCSKSAEKKILSAGGKVIYNKNKGKETKKVNVTKEKKDVKNG